MIFEKTFKGDGSTFGAAYEAEKWLRDNGYSVGPMCVGYPQAVLKGNFAIAKWRNLTREERLAVDGTLDSGRGQHSILRLKTHTEE